MFHKGNEQNFPIYCLFSVSVSHISSSFSIMYYFLSDGENIHDKYII